MKFFFIAMTITAVMGFTFLIASLASEALALAFIAGLVMIIILWEELD